MESRESLRFMVEFGLDPVTFVEELVLRVYITDLYPNGLFVNVRDICVTEREDNSTEFLIHYCIPQVMGSYVLGRADKILSQKQISTIISGLLDGTIDYLCTDETR